MRIIHKQITFRYNPFVENKITNNRGGENDFRKTVFKLNVINGTIWLSQKGDVAKFAPVLGSPPASSSDISLAQAMQALNEVSPSCTFRINITHLYAVFVKPNYSYCM